MTLACCSCHTPDGAEGYKVDGTIFVYLSAHPETEQAIIRAECPETISQVKIEPYYSGEAVVALCQWCRAREDRKKARVKKKRR